MHGGCVLSHIKIKLSNTFFFFLFFFMEDTFIQQGTCALAGLPSTYMQFHVWGDTDSTTTVKRIYLRM